MRIKLLIALFIIAILASSMVFADDGDIYNDGYWRITSTGVQRPITLTTGGQMPVVEAFATGDTLLAAETGKISILRGTAGNDVIFNLPSATAGLRYVFTSDEASYININPYGTDRIEYSTLTAGHSIRSANAAGDSITLVCGTAGYWSVESMKGTWSNGY